MGSLRLTLLRHGQAEAIVGDADDFDRRLTPTGVAEARRMAAHIARGDHKPDFILASTAERAWATAALVAEACELTAERVRPARELYLATPDTIWHFLTRCAADSRHVLICGHNPGLSELASRLGPAPRHRSLSTAGCASAIWLDGEWATLEPEFADRSGFDQV